MNAPYVRHTAVFKSNDVLLASTADGILCSLNTRLQKFIVISQRLLRLWLHDSTEKVSLCNTVFTLVYIRSVTIRIELIVLAESRSSNVSDERVDWTSGWSFAPVVWTVSKDVRSLDIIRLSTLLRILPPFHWASPAHLSAPRSLKLILIAFRNCRCRLT